MHVLRHSTVITHFLNDATSNNYTFCLVAFITFTGAAAVEVVDTACVDVTGRRVETRVRRVAVGSVAPQSVATAADSTSQLRQRLTRRVSMALSDILTRRGVEHGCKQGAATDTCLLQVVTCSLQARTAGACSLQARARCRRVLLWIASTAINPAHFLPKTSAAIITRILFTLHSRDS